MSRPFRTACAACLVSLGMFASACGGGPTQPLVPQHLDIPVAPAPSASHASNGAETHATPATAGASDERKHTL